MTSRLAQDVSSSGSGMIEVIVSPASSGRMLIIALPRACGAAKGRRQTFSLYTCPLDEKNSTGVCVEATNSRETKSSSRVCMPERPLPPRFCARYVDSGTRLT